jgi:branched-chain amino acid transport system substrate-binding protein
MKRLTDFHAKNHPGDQHDAMYVRGWATLTVWVEALKRADKAGQLTGEGIKKALESFKDFDNGGLTEKLTFTPTDHRGTTKTPIYQVKGGKIVKVAEFEMPRKQEWVGM